VEIGQYGIGRLRRVGWFAARDACAGIVGEVSSSWRFRESILKLSDLEYRSNKKKCGATEILGRLAEHYRSTATSISG